MIEVGLDMNEFSLDVSKFIKAIDIDVSKALKKVSLDLFTGIVLKTPVDTGAARSNWQIGVNSAPGSTVEEASSATKKGGALVPSEKAEISKMAHVGPNDTVFITNNLDYIERLEHGHSQGQAPEGMVALTIAEIESQLL